MRAESVNASPILTRAQFVWTEEGQVDRTLSAQERGASTIKGRRIVAIDMRRINGGTTRVPSDFLLAMSPFSPSYLFPAGRMRHLRRLSDARRRYRHRTVHGTGDTSWVPFRTSESDLHPAAESHGFAVMNAPAFGRNVTHSA